MYTVTYLNKHSGYQEIAGYAQTIRKARNLAKLMANEPRLVEDKTSVVIWIGGAGGMRVN